MKLLILVSVLSTSLFGFAQKDSDADLNLTNVVVIGQMDDVSDRYSVEINLTELFSSNGVKAKASLNLMKQGEDPVVLLSDSVSNLLAAEGFDTFVLVSVRGYDKRFKKSEVRDNFETSLDRGNLFSIYKDGIVSVTFEFKFFRNGELVGGDIVKCGNAGSREKVLGKLRKKTSKLILKKWK